MSHAAEMQGYRETIDRLKARQADLEETAGRQWAELQRASTPTTRQNEEEALAFMDLSTQRLEISRLSTKVREYEVALDRMERRVDELTDDKVKLTEVMTELHEQLMEALSDVEESAVRQAVAERRLAVKASDVRRRENALRVREEAAEAQRRAVAVDRESLIVDVTETYFEYSRNAYANLAVFNTSEVKRWFQKAISLPSLPKHLAGDAWAALGDMMCVFEAPSPAQKDCFIKAVECNPTLAVSWNNLGAQPPYTHCVNGVMVTEQQCYLKALEINPRYAIAWINLGVTLDGEENVRVGGVSYSAQKCFIRGLEINPLQRNAWGGLGKALSSTVVVNVSGQNYTKQQCYIKDLEIHPTNGIWFNLGCSLSGEQFVNVNGVKCTEKDCFRRALELDPTDVGALINLARLR